MQATPGGSIAVAEPLKKVFIPPHRRQLPKASPVSGTTPDPLASLQDMSLSTSGTATPIAPHRRQIPKACPVTDTTSTVLAPLQAVSSSALGTDTPIPCWDAAPKIVTHKQTSVLFCDNCHKSGHDISGCYALHPCTHCGRHGHREPDCYASHPQRRLATHPPKPRFDLLTDIIAMDAEMVMGVGCNLLGRLAIVNYNGEVIWDVHTYHKCAVVKSTMFSFSGIKRHQLSPRNGAMEFVSFLETFKKLVQGRVLVTHAGSNDYRALKIAEPATELCLKGIRNTQAYFTGASLKDLTYKHLGEAIQTAEHCPVVDAQKTLSIYRLFQAEIDAQQR